MKAMILKHKALFIVLGAIVLVAVGIAAGMGIMANTSLSKGANYISAEQAKTIALESVGVSPAKATFTKAKLDKDGNHSVYEIEFFSGVNEYELEIDARSGTVLEKKSEALNPQQMPDSAQGGAVDPSSAAASGSNSSTGSNGGTSDYIGIERAKSIALKHAGISAAKATFTKAKLDTDDGVRTYEIEFLSGDREYEYEINAFTGELLDVSSEYNDDYYQHHQENHGHHGTVMGAGNCPYPGCDL
ncbi:MAG: peptidase [Firmicutes bacterium]|nr:peptidase [Bacillota bacterium]